ncbi:hypothetical protein GOBAR_AA06996 [Gossypium barbadense]|uniref:Uncharacterized protein n=1 Tax=Gossypium barbadense TaxID=3634 RepID=A0A2P5YDH7_GOSBA|nr:hypothetical protein GOBAR_AA06996 [Gossypium barbadense]
MAMEEDVDKEEDTSEEQGTTNADNEEESTLVVNCRCSGWGTETLSTIEWHGSFWITPIIGVIIDDDACIGIWPDIKVDIDIGIGV